MTYFNNECRNPLDVTTNGKYLKFWYRTFKLRHGDELAFLGEFSIYFNAFWFMKPSSM